MSTCTDCLKEWGPQVGFKVFLKPDKISREGTLPPNLTESEKRSSFKVLKSDKSQIQLSYFLEMPTGKGRPMNIDGKDTWAWAVYKDDIASASEPPKPEKEDKKAGSAIRAGDTVKVDNLKKLSYGVKEEENNAGFRVLGQENDSLVIELPDNKGDYRPLFGTSTNTISAKDVAVLKKYQVKVGDFVRVTAKGRDQLSRGINQTDLFHGFKVLAVEGSNVVIELPNNKGFRENTYPGKSINRVKEEHIELAPPLKIRRGDKVRIKKEYIPSRIHKKLHNRKLEVVDFLGYDVKNLKYAIKLPDGTTVDLFESGLDLSNKKTSKIKSSSISKEDSVSSFKKGMQVKIREEYRDNLPDSLTTKRRQQSFEIVNVDEDDEQVFLKMPSGCDEAEYDDEFSCRVWCMDMSDLETTEEKEKTNMAKNRGTVTERFVANAEKGAVKAVGRKLTKATKAGILRAAAAAAQSNGMSEGQVAAGLQMFTAFMESEFGNAFISAILGLGLAHLAPQLPIPALQDERLQDLADEMSSEGSAIVMEKVVDIAMAYIAPGIGEVLQGLPPKKETKVRVATDAPTKKASGKKKTTLKIGNHEVDDGEGEAEAAEEEKVKVVEKRMAA